MSSLTTLNRFKAYASITGTSDDSLLTSLIAQVSDMTTRYLGTDDLALADRKEFLKLEGDGNEVGIVRVSYFPVVTVYGIYSSVVEALEVSGISDSFQIAQAHASKTALTLVSFASGVKVSTDLTYSEYATVALLSAAVDAISGWESWIQGDYDNYPIVDIQPFQGQDALYPTRVSLYIPDYDTMSDVMDFEKDMVRLKYKTTSSELFVWYRAGYTLPTDAVDGDMPAGLELLVHQIIMDIYSDIGKNSRLTSESIGDYSYSKSAEFKSYFDSKKRELDFYRKKTL